MLCNSCGQHHAPGTPCAPTQVQAAAPAPAPVNVQGVDVQQLVAELRELLAGSVQSVPTTPIPPGPASPSGQQAGGPRELSLSEFCQMAVDAQTGRAELPRELRAALSDVVPADSGTGAQGGAFFRPAYLDELWDQSTYVRRFIDNAVTVRPLPRALQVTGFRWVEKPAMADYAGNKTAVPSNPVSLEPVTVPVTRSAGAHDVDRAYIDLGSPDFLAAYFEAQTDSYRQLSDGKAATVAWNGAAVLGDGAGVTTGVATDVLAAVVALVVELSNIGEGVEYIALAPGLISQLLGITDDTAPAFFQGSFQLGNMGDGNLGGLRFFTTPALPAAGLLGGTRAATFWHELATPIRVQAENIANGGVDLGVFGYHAGYVRNSRQIRKVTVTV